MAQADAENSKRQAQEVKRLKDANKVAIDRYAALVRMFPTPGNPATVAGAAAGGASTSDDADIRELLRISADLERVVTEAQGDFAAAREQAAGVQCK